MNREENDRLPATSSSMMSPHYHPVPWNSIAQCALAPISISIKLLFIKQFLALPNNLFSKMILFLLLKLFFKFRMLYFQSPDLKLHLISEPKGLYFRILSCLHCWMFMPKDMVWIGIRWMDWCDRMLFFLLLLCSHVSTHSHQIKTHHQVFGIEKTSLSLPVPSYFWTLSYIIYTK